MGARSLRERRREAVNERLLRDWAFSTEPEAPLEAVSRPPEAGPTFDHYDPADGLSRAISSPSRRDEDPLEERLERWHNVDVSP